MEQKTAPLSDLSFFRFPEVTADVVRNITLLVLLLVLTVLITVLVQRWLAARGQQKGHRRGLARRLASELHMDRAARQVLERLLRIAAKPDEYALAHDAEAFEAAAENVAAQAGEEELSALHRLRQVLHMNVMNPELALVSTRQLLRDLPVRLLAHPAGEKLDLYCSVLEVNEQYLLIDLPYDEAVYSLLSAHPDVELLHWRERDGETVFRIRLEPVEQGQLSVFRARHAMRDVDTAQRAAFRLLLDQPVTFTYLERAQLLARRKSPEAAVGQAAHGQGRLVDLGYGGASLVVPQPLAPGGFAQLHFELHGQPMRLMLEVLYSAPGEGGYVLRGQFRGLGEEARARLHGVLSREQLKRLREKEIIRVRTEG